MADISKVNSVEWGNLAGVGGVAKAAIGKLGGTIEAPGGIPASITEGEYLAHWYKMDEGSTSAVTDAGLSASSTDMTLVGAASESGGPSAIGTPSVIKFNGTTGIGSVIARSDGSNTVIGQLFDTNTWSASWWMKDTTEGGYPNGDWRHWIGCVDVSSWHWLGWGVRYYFGNMAAWGYAGARMNVYTNMWSTSMDLSAWRHYVLTFNDTSNEFETWIDGVKTIAYDADDYGGDIDTSVGDGTVTPDPDDQYFAIGGVKYYTGTNAKPTAPYFSDLRFYNITLSDANIAAIYAGDWT